MSDLTPRDKSSGEVVRRRAPSIPIGFRPAPSDDELETNVLERWQGFGVLLSLFLALFLPAYMLFFEPYRTHDAALEQREGSIKRGEEIFKVAEEGAHGFQAGCARCHGSAGAGGQEIDFRGGKLKPPSLNNVFTKQMVDQKKSPREAYQYVYETVVKGRPTSGMPTWGLGYGGPMNDQQIADVINYLISIQVGMPEELYAELAMSEERGPFSRLIAFAATH